jgi:hypothetical protein
LHSVENKKSKPNAVLFLPNAVLTYPNAVSFSQNATLFSFGIYQSSVWYIPTIRLVYTKVEFGIYQTKMKRCFKKIKRRFGNLKRSFGEIKQKKQASIAIFSVGKGYIGGLFCIVIAVKQRLREIFTTFVA